MLLLSLPIGKLATIAKIEGDQLALQLAQMGIIPHIAIKMLRKNAKTILIETQSTRIILGSGIATAIEVE